MATKRIQGASLEEISDFLSTTFEPRASGLSATKEIDMSEQKTDSIEMWNFLVDCFKGEEDFQSNILSQTFRCPQVLTNKLSADLPSENWLGEFILSSPALGTQRRTGFCRRPLQEKARNYLARKVRGAHGGKIR